MGLKRLLPVVLLALAICAPAQARSPFRLIGEGTVWTDGDRYAVVQLEGGTVRVIDDRLGRSWDLAAHPTCYLGGAAAGHLLWDCTPAPPRLQDIATGDVTDVPGWDAYVAATQALQPTALGWFGPEVRGFGSSWARGVVGCYHCPPQYGYVDWHSGRFVSELREVATRLPDLDAPDLDVPLCAPLTRRAYHDRELEPFADAQYEPPWFMREASYRVLRLYHCGRRKPLIVRRCGRTCDASLGGGYLFWTETSTPGLTTIKAFRLADRRKFVIAQTTQARFIAHTRRAVYVERSNGNVYSAPLRVAGDGRGRHRPDRRLQRPRAGWGGGGDRKGVAAAQQT
jgi:hypothetical protein